MNELVLITLVVLLFGSNIFWANMHLKLANRVMSKNYAEFVQATKKPTKPQLVPEDMSDPLAERHAADMNSLIGVF